MIPRALENHQGSQRILRRSLDVIFLQKDLELYTPTVTRYPLATWIIALRALFTCILVFYLNFVNQSFKIA